MLANELCHRPSLARKREKVNSVNFRRHFVPPGLTNPLISFDGRKHQGSYKKRLEITSTAGKNDLKDDDLGT